MLAWEDYRERWVIGLVSGVVFCLIYFPFHGHAWGIHLAILGTYSSFMLTYILVDDECADLRLTAWSDLGWVLGLHLVYLLAFFVWETFWFGNSGWGPRWLTEELPGTHPQGFSFWNLVGLAGGMTLVFQSSTLYGEFSLRARWIN